MKQLSLKLQAAVAKAPALRYYHAVYDVCEGRWCVAHTLAGTTMSSVDIAGCFDKAHAEREAAALEHKRGLRL